MGFEAFKLHPDLVTALTKCGFVTPSNIQEKSLIHANFQVDMIIAAKTVKIEISPFLETDLKIYLEEIISNLLREVEKL